MLSTILAWLGSLLGGPFATAAVNAYKAKLTAENSAEKIAADLTAQKLALNEQQDALAQQMVIAEQGRWWTAIIRPLFALPFVIFIWKVIVWDRCLFHDFTYDLTAGQTQLLMVVIVSYFGHSAILDYGRTTARKSADVASP